MIPFMSREQTHFGLHSEVTARWFLPLLSLCLSLLSVGFRSVLLFCFLSFSFCRFSKLVYYISLPIRLRLWERAVFFKNDPTQTRNDP